MSNDSLEDRNSKTISCRHCSNYTGSLKELILKHHTDFFELKIVTSRITWMDNVSHRHHGNIKQLTNMIL